MKLAFVLSSLAAVYLAVAAPSPRLERLGQRDRHHGESPFSHTRTDGPQPSGSPSPESSSSSSQDSLSDSSVQASPTVCPAPVQTSDGSSSSDSGPDESDEDVVGTLYFTTNVPDSNTIIMANIGSDGNITYAGTTFAGGSGAHGDDGGANGADVTFSNNLIVVHQDRRLLATANTQSNSVALFSINSDDPSQLTMLGDPVSSQGDYPNSLVFNKAGDRLCVVNAGTKGNVACYDVNSSGLQIQMDAVRSLPNYNQTTPPTGPSSTAGAIAFTEDERNLVVAIKGTEEPPSPGFLAVWPIEGGGQIATDPTIVQNPNPGGLPFSLTPVPGRNAFVSADFISTVDVFDLDGDISDASRSKGTNSLKVDGELNLCWSAYSPTLNRFYLSSPPSSLVIEVTVNDNLQPSVISNHVVPNNALNTDISIATINGTDFLFTLLTNEPGLSVMRLNGPGDSSIVGSANLTGPLTDDGISFRRNFAQGLAVFMKA